MVNNSVVEELALIASAWQFWWIVLAAIPSGDSTGRCWQTGRTREQTVVLLLVAGRQLRSQVFVSLLPGVRAFPLFVLIVTTSSDVCNFWETRRAARRTSNGRGTDSESATHRRDPHICTSTPLVMSVSPHLTEIIPLYCLIMTPSKANITRTDVYGPPPNTPNKPRAEHPVVASS